MKRPMPRPHPYRPQWTPELEGYTVTTVKKSWPGVADIYEFDDLLQEAYVIFLRCRRAFRSRGGNDAAIFMALYKCSLDRRLKSLALLRRRYSCLGYTDKDVEGQLVEDTSVIAEFNLLLQRLPQELVTVLALLVGGLIEGGTCSPYCKAAVKLKRILKARCDGVVRPRISSRRS